MKPRAFLINLARGPVAEELALYRALHDGVIGGCGARYLVVLSKQ